MQNYVTFKSDQLKNIFFHDAGTSVTHCSVQEMKAKWCIIIELTVTRSDVKNIFDNSHSTA